MECEKLAQEKTEMQRHYVMVSTNYGNRSIDFVNKSVWQSWVALLKCEVCRFSVVNVKYVLCITLSEEDCFSKDHLL
jgi:hypothetical protein